MYAPGRSQPPGFFDLSIARNAIALFFAALALGCAPSPPAASGELRVSRIAMGTLVEISARGGTPRLRVEAIDRAFVEIERLEALLSEWRDDSEVSALGRASGGEPVAISPETEAVLRLARDVAQHSDGAFDPTLLPLLRVWGFFGAEAPVPSASQIAAARRRVDWRALEIAPGRARLARADMELALSGIAKGYIADRALASLRAAGLEAALVNAGGDLAAFDHAGRGFPVQIEQPDRPGSVFAEIVLREGGLATSAATYRSREIGGQRVGHILDPRSGRPARGNRSTTVLAASAASADAWATALQVLGDEARARLQARPELEGLIVDAQGEVWTTPSLASRTRWLED